MVNTGMVNGGPSCYECATFCVFFPALGRFLYFKNPFKYAGRLRVNHNMERLVWRGYRPWRMKRLCFQWDIRP
jgi:hypothetical protein